MTLSSPKDHLISLMGGKRGKLPASGARSAGSSGRFQRLTASIGWPAGFCSVLVAAICLGISQKRQHAPPPTAFGSVEFCLNSSAASCCTRTCKMFREDVGKLLAINEPVDGLYPRNEGYSRLHPLFIAAEDLDYQTFEKIIASSLVDVNVRDSIGANAISCRTMITPSQMTKFAKMLPYSQYLNGGVDISRIVNLYPWMSSILRAWQQYGDEPIGDTYSRPAYTRILDAMAEPELKLAELFKKHGGDIQATDTTGSTTLHHAARNGGTRLVAGLLNIGYDPRAIDNTGQAPIHLAARRSFDRVVSLLDAASGDIQDADGRTAGDIQKQRKESMERAHAEALIGSERRLRKQQERGASGGWKNGLEDSSVLQLQAHSNHCERQTAAQIQGRFWDYYRATGTPVVVTDGLSGWNKGVFSKRTIKKDLGHTEQLLGSIPYPGTVGGEQMKLRFSKFLDGMTSGNPVVAPASNATGRNFAGKPIYFFKELKCDRPDRDIGCKKAFLDSEFPSFHGKFEVPDFISSSPVFEQASWQIIIGPDSSGASEHFHYDAANMLLHGAKQWFLTPPDEAGFSNVHPGDDSMQLQKHVISCVQLENEVIYVPRGWGHAVINHGDTVAMAAEFHDKSEPGLLSASSDWNTRESVRKMVGLSTQKRPA